MNNKETDEKHDETSQLPPLLNNPFTSSSTNTSTSASTSTISTIATIEPTESIPKLPNISNLITNANSNHMDMDESKFGYDINSVLTANVTLSTSKKYWGAPPLQGGNVCEIYTVHITFIYINIHSIYYIDHI